MEANELKKILELHTKWLNGEEGGKRADLSDADLSGADLRRADLSGADLRRADLSGADLRRADLSDADLSGADLRRADLRRADLSGADLRRADLRRADLSDADLRWANLSGADLSDADLGKADIDYSCLPLWCGSLSANFDDRQLKQIAYHLVKAGLQSKNASEETKTELRKLIPFANGFHRAEKCGLIMEADDE